MANGLVHEGEGGVTIAPLRRPLREGRSPSRFRRAHEFGGPAKPGRTRIRPAASWDTLERTMKRRSVLTALSLGALGMSGLASVSRALAGFERRDERMPALFVGHGSPMNAIEDNRWSRAWAEVGAKLAPTHAILCVSAHWETKGVRSRRWTGRDHPRLLRLSGRAVEQVYPAPGSPALARRRRDWSKGARRLDDAGVSITAPGRCWPACSRRPTFPSSS